jgi:hypothetical protein
MQVILISVGVLFLAGILGYMYYLGVFISIKIELKELPAHTLFYRIDVGDYDELDETYFEEFEAIQFGNYDADIVSIGFYFDNEQWVKDKTDSRYLVGFFASNITDKQNITKVMELNDLKKMREITPVPALVVEFPWRNWLSDYIGPMKIGGPIFNEFARLYPNLCLEGKEFPLIEIYEESKTVYAIPVGNGREQYLFDDEIAKTPELTEKGIKEMKQYIEKCKEFAEKA